MKTVWILGAGFSRHAGAPLMDDLFSRTSEFYLNHSDQDTKSHLGAVGRFFEKHCRGRQKKEHLDEPVLWSNVEQFLEKLDELQNWDTNLECIKVLSRSFGYGGNFSIKDIRKLASCRLCMEVDEYLSRMPENAERMDPYRYWAKQLRPDDTVVTFNYDTLAEKAMENSRSQCLNFSIPIDSSFNSNDHCGEPMLLKMHGSADWSMVDGRCVRQKSYSNSIEKASPVIAMPGSGKASFISDFVPWKYAQQRIEEATLVNIVGYRMPSSDSLAVSRILTAFRKSKKIVRIQIVLGIDLTSREILRMEKILVANRDRATESGDKPRTYGIEVVPMYAEDYLYTYDYFSDISRAFDSNETRKSQDAP